MKYIANPVEVDAYKITEVGPPDPDGSRWLTYVEGDIGEGILADRAMMARYVPVVGDYIVRQADGYLYLNPKDVFEHKYSLAITGSDGKDYPITDKNIPG